MSAAPSADFWRGKRVLLTGHTGFKGAWLALWLERLGAQVTGLALPPETSPSLAVLAGLPPGHHVDLADAEGVRTVVAGAQPEIVLHLAAQALVRPSYRDPLRTFATNVLGTAHVLEAVRRVGSARVVVAVTTDKVYDNREWLFPYRETDALGGHDPYSASKAAAEIVAASYRSSFLEAAGTALATARAGNVLGGGDWSEDRLLPDAVRAWERSETLHIRRPASTRPWQHVLEPLAAYLVLAERLWDAPELAGAYNFGPETHEAATVRTVIDLARAAYGRGEVHYATELTGPHEAAALALEVAKARHTLGVQPRWGLEATVQRTMAWYRDLRAGSSARDLCHRDLDAWEASA